MPFYKTTARARVAKERGFLTKQDRSNTCSKTGFKNWFAHPHFARKKKGEGGYGTDSA